MSGNCATGIAAIAMRPASVMTIEMTKASRGRSMKMSEIIVSRLPPPGGSAVSCTTWPGRTFWMPSTMTFSPSLQARGDDDVGVAGSGRSGCGAARPCAGRRRPARSSRTGRSAGRPAARPGAAPRCRSRITAVTNWPSISCRSGLGMVAAHDQRVGLLVDLRIGQVPDAALRVFLAVRTGARGSRSWRGRRLPCGAPRG